MTHDYEKMSSEELDRLFRNGSSPTTSYFAREDGDEWSVTLLDGVVPNLGGRPFRHRKRFTSTGSGVVGYNVFFGDLRWGYLRALAGVWHDDVYPAVVFSYAVPQNGRLARRIVDYVRVTGEPGVALGKAYVELLGKKRFLCHFLMRRISR